MDTAARGRRVGSRTAWLGVGKASKERSPGRKGGPVEAVLGWNSADQPRPLPLSAAEGRQLLRRGADGL